MSCYAYPVFKFSMLLQNTVSHLGKTTEMSLNNTIRWLILSQVIIMILHVLGLHKNNISCFVFYDDSMNIAVLHAYIYMNINANSSKV